MVKFFAMDGEVNMKLADRDIPKSISKETYSSAENLIEYFAAQRKIFNQVKSFKSFICIQPFSSNIYNSEDSLSCFHKLSPHISFTIRS